MAQRDHDQDPRRRPLHPRAPSDRRDDATRQRPLTRRVPGANRVRGRQTQAILLNLALGLCAMLVAAATFLAIAPPTDLVLQRVIAEVKQRTGRELVIAGQTRFRLLPSLGFSAGQVTLSGPEGMGAPPLLVADSLDFSIALWPLVRREVKVEGLVLHRPRFGLFVDGSGRRNWDFAEATDLARPRRVRLAQVTPPGGNGERLPAELESFARNATMPGPSPVKFASPTEFNLGSLQIIDGSVAYHDARSGAVYEAKGLNAQLRLPDIAGPLDMTATLAHAGETLHLELKAGSLRELREARSTALTLALRGSQLKANFDGQVNAGSTLGAQGRFAVKAASASALARMAGLDVVGAENLEFSLQGHVKAQPGSVALSSARAALGDLVASGKLNFDTAGPRPQVQASLATSVIDVARLEGLGLGPSVPDRPAPSPAPERPAAPARSIEDLIEQSTDEKSRPGEARPTVRGFSRRTGEDWSIEAFDTAALGLVDLDCRIDIDGLLWRELRLGPTQAAAVLKGGVLKLDISDAQLYGGRAKGLVSIDARQPALVVGANLSTDGVATQAFLKGISGLDLIDGRGRTVIAVSATGTSERELVSTLSGRAELHVTEGAIVGWSAAEITGGLAQGRIPSLDRQSNARTPFSELAGSFQIASGVGRSQDLRLKSPSVEAGGIGTVNIVDRNVDFTVKPKAVGATGLAAVELPIRIAGPWGSARAIPDVNAALKSPQAQESVRQLGKQLQSGDVDGALRSVIGNGPGAEQKVGKAKDLLKQLLGRER